MWAFWFERVQNGERANGGQVLSWVWSQLLARKLLWMKFLEYDYALNVLECHFIFVKLTRFYHYLITSKQGRLLKFAGWWESSFSISITRAIQNPRTRKTSKVSRQVLIQKQAKNRNETGSNLSLGTRLTVLSKRLGRKCCCDATPDRCLECNRLTILTSHC